MPLRGGFSFIELMTVVAIIAIVISSAAPVASSLFQRHREMVLRENLISLRKAMVTFEHNLVDDDVDGEIDEDARGDVNHDGVPGIRGLDDDGDLSVDEDWGGRAPFRSGVGLNIAFDWLMRRDDDEDGVIDEEAFPSDLNDLAMKAPILHKTIPLDPTLRIAAWSTVTMAVNVPTDLGKRLANNDSDYLSGGAIFISTDTIYQAGYDVLKFPPPPPLPAVPALTGGEAGVAQIDEDGRDRVDREADTGLQDGRKDEDPVDVLDIRSYNSSKSLNQTSYSEW